MSANTAADFQQKIVLLRDRNATLRAQQAKLLSAIKEALAFVEDECITQSAGVEPPPPISIPSSFEQAARALADRLASVIKQAEQ